MNRTKPIVAVDISTTGAGGGPYTSSMRLMNSTLKEKVDFRILEYKSETGRLISIKRIRDLVKQLKSIRPDIVHFSGLMLSGFHVAVACKLAGIKRSIVVIRGSSTEALDIGLVKRILMGLLEMITLLLSTTYYGVSKYSSRLPVTRLFRRKSSGFIYNLPEIADKSITAYDRKDFGFREEDIIIVSVGRITRDKGYHILQDTIQMFNTDSRVRFLIIGTGHYLETMRNNLSAEEAAGRVVFAGFRDDVKNILPMCDLFVLPTLHETLSNALLEASVSGLPLIASDTGGIPEIIEPGYNGLLVKKNSPGALYNAMRRLVNDAEERHTMGLNAQKIVKNKFAEEDLINKVYKVYKKLLK